MATDVRGHTVPAASDHPSRAALTALALSIRDPIPVASAAARATKLSDLSAAGITPSTSNPIAFWRADAGAGLELEYTTDGSTFWTVSTAPSGWTAVTLNAGVANTASFAPLAYRLEDGGKTLRLRGTRLTLTPVAVTAGVDYNLASGANVIAAAGRPDGPRYATAHFYSAGTPLLARLNLNTDGSIAWRASVTTTATIVEFTDTLFYLENS